MLNGQPGRRRRRRCRAIASVPSCRSNNARSGQSPTTVALVNKTTVPRFDVARRRIHDWLGRDGLLDLLHLFGGRDPGGPATSPRIPGNAEYWLGGEDAAFLATVADDDLPLRRILAIEEMADFCWNFRQGFPRGVLHLLREEVDLRVARGSPGLSERLPLAVDPEQWSTPSGRAALLHHFLDNPPSTPREPSASDEFEVIRRLLPQTPASTLSTLLSQVRAYPGGIAGSYQERWEAASMRFDGDTEKRVHNAATQLGLVNATVPARETYDHVVVLGGGGRSPLLRAQYAHEMLTRQGVSAPRVWMLGSPRPLDLDRELPLVASYAPDAQDEFGLMDAAMRAAFKVGAASDDFVCGCSDDNGPCPAWRESMATRFSAAEIDATKPHLQHARHRFAVDDAGREFHVIGAATGRPPNRPNTADTYELLARLAHFTEAQNVLVVTTQVFVPFQSFDAQRMLDLPYGVSTDVVGFGADRGDRPQTPEFLLQEILSAIRSARRLAVASAPSRAANRA
jgi:hypothetical protein